MEQLIEKYAKIPKQQRFAIFAGIVAALFAGFYYFLYTETAVRFEQLETKYEKLESERAEKQAYVDNLAKYEARLNELQQDLSVARAQLPDSADIPQLLAQLGNKARQSGLDIDRFEPRGETVTDFYGELGIAVKVRGSYHEIATFIDSIGKLDRIVNVTDIAMLTPRTVNQKVIVNGTFAVKTYRFIKKD